MNAVLDIRIRVGVREAMSELRAVKKEIDGLSLSAGNAGRGGMGAFTEGLHKAMNKAEQFGKNLQWTGRQLEFSFTLPLVLAGAAATKWALENEAAMTRVAKVYGDGTRSSEEYRKELDQLGETFSMLSSRFGVNRAEVIGVGEAWAQAGAEGIALARATKATLEFMIVSGEDATKSTEALIATQAVYRLSTQELSYAVAELNAIENQTAIDMGGLIEGMRKAGGSAVLTGIDIRHLGAMMAALTPMAGSASQAATSLKTMISRLFAPTEQAREAIAALGVDVNTAAWQSANGAQRFEMLAKGIKNLTAPQQALVASVLGSRLQYNRLAILLEDINRSFSESTQEQSYYKRALDATADSTDVMNAYNRELLTFLQSNPQKVQILTNTIKNLVADAIIPLLPALVAVLARLAQMVQWFSELSPETQQWIMMTLLAVAVLGTLSRYVGATILLFSTLGKTLLWLPSAFSALGGVMRMFGTFSSGLADIFAKSAYSIAGIWDKLWAFASGVLQAAYGFFTSLFTSSASTAIVATETMTGTAIAGSGQVAAAAIGAGQATSSAWLATSATVAGSTQAALGAASNAMTVFATVATGAAWQTVDWWTMAMMALPAATQTAIGTSSIIFGELPAAAGASFWQVILFYRATMLALMQATEETAIALGTGYTAMGQIFKQVDFQIILWWQMTMRALTVGAAEAMGEISTIFGTGMQALPAASSQAALTAGASMKALPAAASMAAIEAGAAMNTLPVAATAASSEVVAVMGAGGTAAGTSFLAGITWPLWAVVAVVIAVVAAIVGILMFAFNEDFRNRIIDAFNWVVDKLSKLPEIIAKIFRAVVRVISRAMEQVIEWLSYLNPFQRHSPSLVENVTRGMDVIVAQYARVNNISARIRSLAAAHMAFVKATGGTTKAFEQAQIAEDRAMVAKRAPGAVPAFDALSSQMVQGRAIMEQLKAAINEQQIVVDHWDQALEMANSELDRQESLLRSLNDLLSASESRMRELADTQITGMGAMSDAIFENEMAQKRLRLEIMRMGEAGQSIEDLQSRLAALAGEIESLQAEREDLRLSGAGSEVLDVYDAEIAALEAQRDAIEEQGSAVNALQAQLEELQRQGEMLDLENSITFDPQLRQIDQMVQGLNELPFDQIVAGIAAEKAKQEELNLAIAAQQVIVDQATASRDAIKAKLEEEKLILDTLKDAYQQIADLVSDMDGSLNDFVGSLRDAGDAAKEVAQSEFQTMFDEAAMGDFEQPYGSLGIEEGSLDEFNAQLEQELQDALAGMGDIDLFAPIREKWDEFVAWFSPKWEAFAAKFGRGLERIGQWFSDRWTNIKNIASSVWDGIQAGWNAVVNAISVAWNATVQPVIDALAWVWGNVLQPAIQAFADFFSMVWNDIIAPVISWVWNTILLPFATWIIDTFNGRIRPVLELIGGVFMIVFELVGHVISWVWDNVLQPVVDWLVSNFGNVLPGIFNFLGGIVVGVWDTISRIITWVWENAIQPVFNAIVSFIQTYIMPVMMTLWQNVVVPVWNGISAGISYAWNNVISPVFEAIKTGVGWLADKFFWLKDNVITPVWNGIYEVIRNIWASIASIIERGINFAIEAFNKLASGVSTLGGVLGLDIQITEMERVDLPPFASGGITSGPALVGEGNARYPEFVIPTDPTFRRQAENLFYLLANQLGIPMHAMGGVLGATPASIPSYATASGGSVTNNFYGDLSFPNVKDGDGAKDFLDNLEALTGAGGTE